MCDDKDVHFLIKVGVGDDGGVFGIVSWWSPAIEELATRREKVLLSTIVHELALEVGSVLDRAARVAPARAEREKKPGPHLM